MKKQLKFLFFITLICLALAGCTGGNGASQKDEDSKKNIVIGFSQVGSESSWRVANSESMKKALSEAEGFELIFDDARQKQENQYKAIRKFIQQQVDYIVLAPMTEDGWDDVLLEAKNAGIPVIIVDRQVNANDKLYTSWIGSDFFKEGEYAAEWLDTELKKLGKGTTTVSILHLMGTIGATAQIGRSNGLSKVASLNANWKIYELQGEYTEAKSYELTKAFLLEQGKDLKLDVLFCENDNMAFGAMRALDEAGIEYGLGNDIIIISFDAVKSAMEQCLAGNIDLCVECNPLHGPRVASVIRELEAGQTIEKKYYVEETAFSYQNITQSIIDARQY